MTLPLALSLVVGVMRTLRLALVSPTMLLDEVSYPEQDEVAKLDRLRDVVVVFSVPVLEYRSIPIPEMTLTLSGLIKFEIKPSNDVTLEVIGAVSVIFALEELIMVHEEIVTDAVLLEQLGLDAVEN